MTAAASAAGRKTQVLELVAAGMTPAAAAQHLGVARSTAYDWCGPTPGRARKDTVPARPFVDWLKRTIPLRWDHQFDASRALGIDDSQLRRILNHPERRLQLATIDRLLCNAGDVHMVSILYPLDDQEAIR